MLPIDPSVFPPLEFGETEPSKKFRASSKQIAWIHTLSDVPGAKFDLAIKDGLGRTKFERKNFGTETKEAGEMVRLPVFLGEELEVVVDNIRGAKNIKLFIN